MEAHWKSILDSSTHNESHIEQSIPNKEKRGLNPDRDWQEAEMGYNIKERKE